MRLSKMAQTKAQYGEADLALHIQVWVEAHTPITCLEVDMGRLQGVVVRDLDVKEVKAMLIGCALWANNERNGLVDLVTPDSEDSAIFQLFPLLLKPLPLFGDALLGQRRE
eukprot:CAMPEP_0179033746 /NCGR_PEP_ID=MMETSP0796-20121207/12258_1 /TAXON_ID=73915 /ORGANISM="Pyrodinium bahamense, Strain pbaha01" /LENGTH=110 /DNA_ID=CAMNT_0020730005 /DNA_START=445 /DNA_END=775 /DNA_ORIENTATION=-